MRRSSTASAWRAALERLGGPEKVAILLSLHPEHVKKLRRLGYISKRSLALRVEKLLTRRGHRDILAAHLMNLRDWPERAPEPELFTPADPPPPRLAESTR